MHTRRCKGRSMSEVSATFKTGEFSMRLNTSTGCINRADCLRDIGTQPQSGLVRPALPGDHTHLAGWYTSAAIGSGLLPYGYALIGMHYISKLAANALQIGAALGGNEQW